MEAAKGAVKSFLGKSGHHDTVVDETVNPAVTSEQVKPARHEETTSAIDREVHQDHYHTTVQPIQHREVLPERHTHQQMPVEQKEFVHGDSGKVRSAVEAEAAKFSDTSMTHPTTHTASAAPAVTGEHVHHHVHETVQPVINKETIQPEVVHTTVPVHEVHHAQSEHHGMSTLPTKTLNEFTKMGGSVGGAGTRHEEYEGHPRPYNPNMQSERSQADQFPKAHDGLHGSHSAERTNVSGIGHSSSAGAGYSNTTCGAATTGTALGGRSEGNTTSRSLDPTHQDRNTSGSVGDTYNSSTSGVGNTTRGLEHSATGGAASHSSTRDNADNITSSDANKGRHGGVDSDSSNPVGDDKQHPSQGEDPSLIKTGERTGKWTGDGVDGSHSAVFGLTPDGHKNTDTSHGVGSLKPAHSTENSNTSTSTSSRGVGTGAVADQMNDPRVSEKGHGHSVGDVGSAKPGAGAPGGEQGLGEVRPGEHGPESKVKDKLDPTTDADNDGKRGVMD